MDSNYAESYVEYLESKIVELEAIIEKLDQQLALKESSNSITKIALEEGKHHG